MKTTIAFLLAAALAGGLLVGSCAKKPTMEPEVVAQLKPFVVAKAAQESTLADAEDQENSKLSSKSFGKENLVLKSPDCRPFFAAAAKGDWPTASNLWSKLQRGAYNPIAAHAEKKEWLPKAIGAIAAAFHPSKTKIYLHGKWEQPVRETFGAIEAFATGNEKYSRAFGDDIIRSIPPGSIYFGGSDPGRFIVTALEKSQAKADPFFTLTPLELANGYYLDYLRSMYGDRIYIPTDADAYKCFQTYTDEVAQQEKNRLLSPDGEANVKKAPFQTGGQSGVREMNGLLAKIIFDKNTNREFYFEEIVPLEWMFPHLEPHGLIMKINRQPLAGLSDEIIQKDRDYWTKYVTPMIGDWLNDNTTVGEVTAFVKKVFLRHEFIGFKGDPLFVQNDYSCRAFSRLRSSLGGLYAWRAQNTSDAAEKQRMNRAADLAFRQAWALCPYLPITTVRYVNFLAEQNRMGDAILIAETAAALPQNKDNDFMAHAPAQLKEWQNKYPPKPAN